MFVPIVDRKFKTSNAFNSESFKVFGSNESGAIGAKYKEKSPFIEHTTHVSDMNLGYDENESERERPSTDFKDLTSVLSLGGTGTPKAKSI